ncbi:DNA topoisomerase (ATP-hydrolyzing) SKDI_08G0200 [Saccharomyces kudriavzevii IFO 1802]|uniref:Uncharacterized protein n=2 Tax=Saccharomyces kudriavzevii (strain ATCC MYA-4449 / AS 2.2408 / CBS 8840 / NBRC 1802 / NCYC 2889) TaxID=226230 RepID=A0AA35JK88_SACK1|nr:uncharacterized protein SKDI_08G0200 [Saccharomyces kudriavzevii IFO 1802]EJT42241.1 SPO11-like protein [Saccharomyces kudriavzevii IFO 1802]CAI4063376.1 hypothetical protein SKDI_08G0200 [Saccharomyces kudriavzevii IFO 1802]
MALEKLSKKYRTRQELLKALTPRTRSIHLSSSGHSSGSASSDAEVLYHIKQILSLAANSLEQQQQPFTIIFQNKTRGGSSNSNVPTRLDFPLNGPHLFTHRFRLKKCSILLNLLKIVMEKLPLGKNTTVRDIFYSNVELFQRQANVVQWLDIIRFNFNLSPRKSLNIIPAQKGLIYSPFPIYVHDKIMTGKDEFQIQKQTVSHGKPCLIPFFQDDAIIELETTSNCNLVIVEKEAVFTKLVSNYHRLNANTVLITGKGFPDFLTRLFLKKLEQDCSSLISSCSIFTDADPYGISIALNYINSSANAAYNCAMVDYRGIYITQVLAQNNRLGSKAIQLLNLSQRDCTLAKNLIVSLTGNNEEIATSPFKNFIVECQREIFFHKKAEMNEIDASIFQLP